MCLFSSLLLLPALNPQGLGFGWLKTLGWLKALGLLKVEMEPSLPGLCPFTGYLHLLPHSELSSRMDGVLSPEDADPRGKGGQDGKDLYR